MNDEEATRNLLINISAGDEAAFAEFYRLFESRLYCFIKARFDDSFEAADILHEVFIEVWKKADRFQGRSKVSTWLFGIAFNKTMDRLRKKSPDFLGDELLESIPSDAPGLLTCLINKEDAGNVHYCIETLKPAMRSVLELTFFENLSYKAIAAIVGCPENTVKTRMFHAKQAMKRCLTRRMGEGGLL